MSKELSCLIWINEMIKKCPDKDLPSLLCNIAFINEDGKDLDEISIEKAIEFRNGLNEYVISQIEKETLKPIPLTFEPMDYINEPYAMKKLIGTEAFRDAVIRIAQ